MPDTEKIQEALTALPTPQLLNLLNEVLDAIDVKGLDNDQIYLQAAQSIEDRGNADVFDAITTEIG